MAAGPSRSPARKAPVAEQPAGNRWLSALSWIKLGLIFGLVVVAGYLIWAHTEWFSDPRRIKGAMMSWGAWAPALYMLLYAIGPSFLVPGAVMTIAGGLAFGTFWGSIYAVVGAFTGALVAFAAGRFLGKDFVRRVTGERFKKTLHNIARNGFRIVLYLRIFPIIPYNALNLLAGASPISFNDYFWATIFGLGPGTVLFAFLGNELWHPGSPRFFLALGLLLVCLALGELYRRLVVQESSNEK